MDYLAETTCPNWESQRSCEACANPTYPGKCCCHSAAVRNLGIQVGDYMRRKSLSKNDALDAVADMYIDGLFGEGEDKYPVGTYFGYVNLLDDDIMRIQRANQFLTAQFTREPQHSQVCNEFSDPVYAFEILAQWPSSVYSWDKFCALDGTDFGTIDVVGSGQINDYLDHLYLPQKQPPGALAPTSKWVPRPEFAHVFDRNDDELAAAAAHPNPFVAENRRHGRW
eukprot:TRINITY_DN9173_c0_g1_i1.p1 TRINITY_DN9173_c0_g1~~TRINITY_DN9173_c0_g1_i1.p1  ORF type:complete len:250 (-),score=113.62 TRINITY_DN9173_c0_g1_i1:61-735(-)